MWSSIPHYCIYEGESVNRSQMDIKRKTYDIRKWKELFLDISSTNIDTLVPSLYQPVENHSIEVLVVSATSATPLQPLRHQRKVCHSVVNRFTRQTLPTVKRKYFFLNMLCIESFGPQQTHKQRCSSIVHSSSTVAILVTETSLWTCACLSAT
jgi:hypothetical protein